MDGKASGNGRAVWKGSYGETVYDGEYREGKAHGRGTYTASAGHSYEGEWQGGWPHGQGTYVLGGSVYEGRWNKGCYGRRGAEWAVVNTTAEACGFVDCANLDSRNHRLRKAWKQLNAEAIRIITAKYGRVSSNFSFMNRSGAAEINMGFARRLQEYRGRRNEFRTDVKHCKK